MKILLCNIDAGISGFESPAAQYTELSLSLDDILVQRPSSTFFGKASGDSMVGHGIFDGDLLIIDRAEEVKNKDVIVANLNGCFVCKQIDLQNMLLLSSSDEYAAYYLSEADSFQIEGVVMKSIRLLRGSEQLCMR